LLWQGERVTYDGNYYQYSNAQIAPVPVRQPLPLWIGGSSKAAIRRTVGLGNGWLAGIQSPAQIKPVVAAIKAEGLRINRPLDDDHYGAGIGFRFGSWDEPVVQDQVARLDRFPELDSARSYLAVGNAEEILETLASYREAGISKFVLRPIGTSSADIMNQTEKLINEVIPAVHQK
jgi:alkanesulfonate monooxygenase SsuD/methylene tetrahydromethanopterin reductase-like flavin-dependent oxidoreductase (luciferase family)